MPPDEALPVAEQRSRGSGVMIRPRSSWMNPQQVTVRCAGHRFFL